MRKHFDGKKSSHARDNFEEDSRKHKKMNSYRHDKNWKNHLLEGKEEEEPLDEDFFHFDDEDEE
jgi:hypothetical protein